MQHGIGRATHGDVQCHGIEERLACSDALGQYAFVAIAVVLVGILHHEACSLLEEFDTVLMCCHDSTIAGEGKSDSLVEAVHRIGGKHTRAATASGTCATLDSGYLFIAYGLVGRLDHRVDKVEMLTIEVTCLHRSARHKYRRDIQTH